MNNIEATNEFVFVILDEILTEKRGLLLPPSSKEKPSRGKIITVGELVEDTKIKNGVGKNALFHKGSGASMEYEGVEYQVLEGKHIIAVV
jgi:co-chaperonin GroES (HSP10)